MKAKESDVTWNFLFVLFLYQTISLKNIQTDANFAFISAYWTKHFYMKWYRKFAFAVDYARPSS